jgi:NAD(P)-dependent dehydrogenase (short-subunit alcohol dehydrogenase family)
MFRSQLAQFFPPKPNFTEENVPLQDGKVFLITGGASGIGLELTKMLYQKNGRVYIAGRSEDNARQAINEIQSTAPEAKGSLEFLYLDLSDLTSIKPAVDAFKAKEQRLDILWNNAGVSQPPLGSTSKQGIELQLATNCLGPFLLTQLLLPLLEATAAAPGSTSGSVRVIWTSSQIMELSAPNGGIIMSEIRSPPRDVGKNYTNSKTANLFLSAELARRQRQSSASSHRPAVVSVALNPGAASTNLFRHTPYLWYLAWPLFYPVKLAATTQLYAGLSGDITAENSGCYVVPWGRLATHMRPDFVDAMKPEGEEGGTGRARELWEFCEEATKDFM